MVLEERITMKLESKILHFCLILKDRNKQHEYISKNWQKGHWKSTWCCNNAAYASHML